MTTIAALMLGMAGLAVADDGSVGVSPAPKVVQEVGVTDAVYEPTRWPIFGASSSDNEACANGLRTGLSGKYKSETHPEDYPPAEPRVILAKTLNLSQLGFGPYRGTSKIIVSWTVRAEGYQSIINPWSNSPRLCHPWHGTIEESFPGGELATVLYVNGAPRSGEFSMTFPTLGKGTNYNPGDPTITGSIVLTPEMFGKEFPETMTCEVRWINRTTGAQVKAPAFMRSMTFFLTPVTGQ
jgi:hypothetical protein